MLIALSIITSTQANGTKATTQQEATSSTQLLN
jgi:hypothetical protein